MTAAMAAQEEHPNHAAHQSPEAAKESTAPSEAEALLQEFAKWSVEGLGSDEWNQAQEMSEIMCEHQARRRYWDDVDADRQSIRGYDVRVELYWPDMYWMKYPMPFGQALGLAYLWCCETWNGVEGEPEELIEAKRICNCIWQLVSLFQFLCKLRWKQLTFPAFQWFIDMLIRPNVGLLKVCLEWVHSSREERQARNLVLSRATDKVLTEWFGQLKEILPHNNETDAALKYSLPGRLDAAAFGIWRPSEDQLKLLNDLPRHDLGKQWDEKVLTRIMVELRSAWAEPRFQRRKDLLYTDPENPEVKSGRHGLFRRHNDILEKHGLSLEDLCKKVSHAAKHDRPLQRLSTEVAALYSSGQVPQWLPVAREEVFAPGRRVWAFYDIYLQSEQWKYRYVKVDEPPTSFPLVGIAAGWFTGTVVGKPDNNSAESLDGFQKVRVRLDGYFCDSRLLDRSLLVKATGKTEFAQGHYFGRSCVAEKEFMIPISMVRDIGDEPPQPLLSVLNVRPMDYYSNGKHSDYNICNDGYVQDMFHGPCSMREQMPTEYEVVTVFIKETENLDRLDAEYLRSRLHGKNIIGWYLQWPQIQSKSLWGNGSVRKQQFFNFCIRAERAKIRSGWPHQSHVYELLAGKIWIPRMSLCREFKVMPSAVIDYADFKRSPARVARKAILHIMHLQRVVWGKDSPPIEAFKGVVKFGYSWCGTDVLPFIGQEALVKVCEAMFSKEGNEQTTIIVQEMLPNVFAECRNLCFYDRLTGTYHKERLWVAQMQKLKDPVEGFTGMASSNVLPSEIVGKNILGGDFATLHVAEKEADFLCDLWLRWARAEVPEPLQCTRIDFLVARGDEPGQAKVWTCEVGECGGSLCQVEVHARNTVALNNAVLDDPSGRFPAPLHRPLPRNDGFKSL